MIDKMKTETIIIIMTLSVIAMWFLGWLVVYNPIIKIKDGCWSWERQEDIQVFELRKDYNLTCEDIRDFIILDLWDSKEYVEYVEIEKCNGKVVSLNQVVCDRGCFRKNYAQGCLK